MILVSPQQILQKKKIIGYINTAFQWSEFIKPEDGIPDLQTLKYISYIAGVLKVYKEKLFDNKPVIVTSGYRSMAHHLRIYAEKGITDKSKIPMGSYHLTGKAVDFIVKGMTIAEVYRLMDLYHFGGVEKTGSTWVHIDNRGKICRFDQKSKVIAHHYNHELHEKIFK